MTDSVNSCTRNANLNIGKTEGSRKASEKKEDTSLFGNQDTSSHDVFESSSQPKEKEVSTAFIEIKAFKNKDDKKESGKYQLKIYDNENETEATNQYVCFIYKTGKNEKKYKFTVESDKEIERFGADTKEKGKNRGYGNAVDLVTKGNEVSAEVTNGNRRLSLNYTKNKDGSYELVEDEALALLSDREKSLLTSKKCNSLDEIALNLNQIDLPSTQETDGEISASKQSQWTGDCSLLSVLNALSHSEYGRNVLDKAFVINEEKNTITVNLPGFGTSFEYNMSVNIDKSNNQIMDYNYSSGDAEAYFLERAMSDALTMVKKGELKLSKDAPSWCKDPKAILGGKPIEALEPHQVLYALTGLGGGNRTVVNKEKNKNGDVQVNSKDASNAKKVLNECEKGETTMIAANLSKKGAAEGTPGAAKDQYVKDSFGKQVLILKGHSYGVKDVSTKANGEKVITIIDPYDSSKEITLNEDTFLKTFNILDSVKIKGNNSHPKYYK